MRAVFLAEIWTKDLYNTEEEPRCMGHNILYRSFWEFSIKL